jgi:hypothetical protein
MHVLWPERPLRQYVPREQSQQQQGEAAYQRCDCDFPCSGDPGRNAGPFPSCPDRVPKHLGPVLNRSTIRRFPASISAVQTASSSVLSSNGSLFSANYYLVLSPRIQGPTSTLESSPRASLHQATTSTLARDCPPSRATHSISAGSLQSPDLGSEARIILGCLLDGHIDGTAMVDCGATSQFIDQDFPLKNGLKLRRKAVPEVLTVVDGRTSVAGDLTHEVTIQLLIDQHLENVVFQVTKRGSVPLILGQTWLRRHNPLIDWANNTVNFRSAWCQAQCLPHRHEAPEPSWQGHPGSSLIFQYQHGLGCRLCISCEAKT